MFNLEKSIKTWLRQFQKYRAFDEAGIHEMELHVRDHIQDLVQGGHSERAAFNLAVADFGEIPGMAKEEYWNQARKRSLGSTLLSALFKNYYKTSIRSMMRNPLSTFINIIGLSAAIGICVFTYAFTQWTYRTDQFHEKKHEVYLATFFADRDGSLQQNGRTPRPLASLMKQDFPQVEDVCRIEYRNVVVKYKDHVFNQRIDYVDPSFLDFFTFPLKWGDPNSLADVNSIILSEKIAVKYFGKQNPIGKELLIKFDKERSKTFKVSGVAEKFPPSISIAFGFLINYQNFHATEPDYNFEDWSKLVSATFIKVTDTADLKSVKAGMGKYVNLHNAIASDWNVSSFGFEPLATLHKRSGRIRDSISHSTDEGYVAIVFLAFVGVFMVALACFNYINIAIVSAAKRLKEIGIRKTIGANRRVVIVQFLSENLIATSLALVLGLLLGAFLFIPWFESLFYFDMGFKVLDIQLLAFLIVVLFLTAIASGIYPAVYVSRFPVTGILKRNVQFGKKNRLTKVILAVQLVFSCMFITCAVMFTQNSMYLFNRGWGYNEDEALYAEVPGASEFKQLRDVLAQNPNVISISGSAHHLGRSSKSTLVETTARSYEVDYLAVDDNYLETLGVQLVDGRDFRRNSDTDKRSVIVNEVLASKILGDDPLNEQIKIDSVDHRVIGVVKDFHTYSFETEVKPTFFRFVDEEDYRYLSLRVANGKQEQAYQSLLGSWSDIFPEIPFKGGYQEDVWGMYFVEIGIHGKVWRAIATIAILLASLGLYGLVTLNVSGRTREFSIRKVLGADIRSLGRIILNQYVWLFAVALSIGVPISYVVLDMMLDFAYIYRVPMNVFGVSLASILLVAVLLLVVLVQLAKVGKANPTEGLKIES